MHHPALADGPVASDTGERTQTGTARETDHWYTELGQLARQKAGPAHGDNLVDAPPGAFEVLHKSDERPFGTADVEPAHEVDDVLSRVVFSIGQIAAQPGGARRDSRRAAGEPRAEDSVVAERIGRVLAWSTG